MSGAMAPDKSPVLPMRLLMIALLAFTLWASWKVSNDDAPVVAVAEQTRVAPRRAVAKATVAPAALPLEWHRRADRSQPVIDLFGVPPVLPMGPPAVLQSAPGLPPLKLKYMGHLDRRDSAHVFLTDEHDRVISAKVGDDLPDGWKLASMDSRQMVVRHTASGQEQNMQIGMPQ